MKSKRTEAVKKGKKISTILPTGGPIDDANTVLSGGAGYALDMNERKIGKYPQKIQKAYRQNQR